MESWSALPDAALSRAGESSDTLRQLGCAGYRESARHVHRLPYGRNSDRGDYRLVLAEGVGTCSTKHALLAAVAREQGLAVSLTIGIYDMDQANTPGVGPVLAAHGLRSLPEAHCYLRYADSRIDVTRSGVEPEAPIERFHREWPIAPEEIGRHKLELHRDYLRDWLARPSSPRLGLDQLWAIREACIAALGGA